MTFKSCNLHFRSTKSSADRILTADVAVDVALFGEDYISDRFRAVQHIGAPGSSGRLRVDVAQSTVMAQLNQRELTEHCVGIFRSWCVDQREDGTRLGFFPPRTVLISIGPPPRRILK